MRRNYNVLHLIASGGLYGAETVILNLSCELKHHGIKSVLGLIGGNSKGEDDLKRSAEKLNIDTKTFPLKFNFDPSAVFQIADYVKTKNIHIIHSHGYKATLLSFLPSLLLNRPLIATCHLWSHAGDFKLKIYHEMEALIMRFLPNVVGVSSDICRDLICKKIKPEKITLIKNGIDISNYPTYCKNATSSFLKGLGIQSNDFLVGTVGRLDKQKAQHYLLDAVTILKNRDVNIKCLIIGDGRLRNDLEEYRNHLDLEDIVFIPGYRNDIINMISAMDVFILTSVDEGLPMVLLEAMAKKTAVISTPVGEIGNIIKNNHNGLLYLPGDTRSLANHIIYLKNNEKLKTHIENQAYRTFQKEYSSIVMTENYIHLYDKII